MLVGGDIMNIPYVMKKCSKCGEWLVASSKYFHKKKRGKYGLKGQCKECMREYDKEYRETHKEAIAEQKKKWYEENKEARAEKDKKYYEANKEAILEYHKKYYEENKDDIVEYHKKYYEENKDDIAERRKKHYEANKDDILEQQKKRHKKYYNTPQGQVAAFNSCSRRRAKEQNQGDGITKEQWLEMMSFFNWECAYSGKTLTKETRSIDHIDPLNNGGENEIWNCIPMDRSLNCSKQDKEMLDWYIKQPFCTAERLLKIYKWQEYAKNKYDNSIVNE